MPSSTVHKPGLVIAIVSIALLLTTALSAPTRIIYPLTDGCLAQIDSGVILAGAKLVGPEWNHDGGSTCGAEWTEYRQRQVSRPTGWFYATVLCGGILATGLIAPHLGYTVAFVFGAGCVLISRAPQHETVTITESRRCRTYWMVAWNRFATVCTNWDRLW